MKNSKISKKKNKIKARLIPKIFARAKARKTFRISNKSSLLFSLKII